MTDLQVPVNYATCVAVIYTFYNLLYAVTAEERESSSRQGGRGRGRGQETGKRRKAQSPTDTKQQGSKTRRRTFKGRVNIWETERPEGPENHY